MTWWTSPIHCSVTARDELLKECLASSSPYMRSKVSPVSSVVLIRQSTFPKLTQLTSLVRVSSAKHRSFFDVSMQKHVWVDQKVLSMVSERSHCFFQGCQPEWPHARSWVICLRSQQRAYRWTAVQYWHPSPSLAALNLKEIPWFQQSLARSRETVPFQLRRSCGRLRVEELERLEYDSLPAPLTLFTCWLWIKFIDQMSYDAAHLNYSPIYNYSSYNLTPQHGHSQIHCSRAQGWPPRWAFQRRPLWTHLLFLFSAYRPSRPQGFPQVSQQPLALLRHERSSHGCRIRPDEKHI